jgi:hypothetical protein
VLGVVIIHAASDSRSRRVFPSAIVLIGYDPDTAGPARPTW